MDEFRGPSSAGERGRLSAAEDGLPSGWRVNIKERSVGVYEARAFGPNGQVAVRVGSDPDELATGVAADARDLAEQMGGQE